jgi:hypothetical protein
LEKHVKEFSQKASSLHKSSNYGRSMRREIEIENASKENIRNGREKINNS